MRLAQRVIGHDVPAGDGGEYIDPAEPVGDGRDRGIHRCRIKDVAVGHEDAAVVVAGIRGEVQARLPCGIRVDVKQRNLRTLRQKALDRRPADAVCAAGDDDHLIRESHADTLLTSGHCRGCCAT